MFTVEQNLLIAIMSEIIKLKYLKWIKSIVYSATKIKIPAL